MPDAELLEKLAGILPLKVDRAAKAQQIAEAIRVSGGYRWVGIYDVDSREGLVSNIAWTGPSAPAYPTFPISKGLTSRAVANKRSVNGGDVARDSDYLTALDTTRSELIIPVIAESGEVIGTIDVESERVDAFVSRTQALLEECARQLTCFWRGSESAHAPNVPGH